MEESRGVPTACSQHYPGRTFFSSDVRKKTDLIGQKFGVGVATAGYFVYSTGVTSTG